ncbi:MAG TPA: adenosylcobinamide-phosphate synthase CbiB [Thermodesulfobacteriota bacterium]|nr:adenosylcobinamide-phosphate synthase CbiB [Thermodesulfobacteriota bacterium]
MPALSILSAYILDLVLGDPQWFPHPVRLIARLISLLEKLFRGLGSSAVWLQFSGVLLAVAVCGATYAFTVLIIRWADVFSAWAAAGVSVFLAYTTLATRDLHVETRKVVRALEAGDLPLARRELAFLVGRDTADLDEEGIARALVETIGENISDGVIAPFFYLGLGGSAWAMTYKAVNTLDSMVGYRNERYLHLGWASARLDDAANFIPARLSGFIVVAAAFLLGKPWRDSLRILLRDHDKHHSPNSAWPEAALAGALGVRLGGLNYYFGKPDRKPLIGDGPRKISMQDVREAWKILYVSSLIMLLFAIFLSWALRRA